MHPAMLCYAAQYLLPAAGQAYSDDVSDRNSNVVLPERTSVPVKHAQATTSIVQAMVRTYDSITQQSDS